MTDKQHADISDNTTVDPAYRSHNSSCFEDDAQSMMTQEIMNRTSALITERMQPVEAEF
jgi:hypothetical protein